MLLTVRFELLVVSRHVNQNQYDTDGDSHDHAEVGKACDSQAKAVDLAIGDSERGQRQIQQSIEKAHCLASVCGQCSWPYMPQ